MQSTTVVCLSSLSRVLSLCLIYLPACQFLWQHFGLYSIFTKQLALVWAWFCLAQALIPGQYFQIFLVNKHISLRDDFPTSLIFFFTFLYDGPRSWFFLFIYSSSTNIWKYMNRIFSYIFSYLEKLTIFSLFLLHHSPYSFLLKCLFNCMLDFSHDSKPWHLWFQGDHH
jgi:hypothetical protein